MIANWAEQAAARWRTRIVDALARVPGVRAEETADGVEVTGRRLRARWLADPRLRNLRGEL
ncbi:hypothetical protein ASE86_12895 [Sphingomonas sp. Leaf33]|uniref:hypothetical protein n=1 Tax=Sphingomonas sp. Leaf33 TaxID=1736215 RepID=UPI0006FCEEA5|nr:hypothetical protein [Sphingomonas sp. Leaf33]KQN19381.1 hypothetical protein ASE86_12895 [Sphingomonas sp. Leaf33]